MIKITEIIRSLIENSNVTLATCNQNNVPNCCVIACVKVINDKQLLFTDNYFNKTRSNLENNKNVSLATCSADGNQAYQLKGTAQIFTEGEYKEMVDNMECNQGLAHKAAVLVSVTEIWDLADPKLICSEKL
ncbi:pyridoxamine 5'-phosphate oxidase family protein [Patescibacteria group bacterium]|nr:pyridoxamine 5'-phosphate oxidase family protein [Patescibacteria group bacterium]